MNAITYKEIFPYLKDNKMWIGMTNFNKGMYFVVPNDYEYADTYKFEREMDGEKVIRVSASCWFTNLDISKSKEFIVLSKTYDPDKYPKYDNYDAIEVSRVKDIPYDYDGVMGVPITILNYGLNDIEIIGGLNGYKETDEANGLFCGTPTEYIDKNGKVKIWTGPTINKKTCYFRILIRKVQFEIVDINPHFFSLVEQGFEKPKQLSLKPYGMKDPYARILIRKRNEKEEEL